MVLKSQEDIGTSTFKICAKNAQILKGNIICSTDILFVSQNFVKSECQSDHNQLKNWSTYVAVPQFKNVNWIEKCNLKIQMLTFDMAGIGFVHSIYTTRKTAFFKLYLLFFWFLKENCAMNNLPSTLSTKNKYISNHFASL